MRTRLLICFLLFSFYLAKAQNSSEISLKNGNFSTIIFSNTFSLQNELSKGKFGNKYFAIIQFSDSVNRDFIQKNNIELVDYLAKNTFTAVLQENSNFNNLNIKAITVFPSTLKYVNTIFTNTTKNNKLQLAISYYGVNKIIVKNEFQKIGLPILKNAFETNNTIYINYKKELIEKIAAYPFVTDISIYNNDINLLNNESRAAHNASAVAAEEGRNLTGKNVTIGHGDLGIPADHIDLYSKSIDRYTGTGNFHGNHTNGTASGAGIINEKYKGIAYKSPTVNCLFTDILVNAPSYITDYNMVATNNSYYSGLSGCSGNRAYNNLSNFIDAQTYTYQSNLHVFSAGNDGQDFCFPYLPSFGTIKSGFQTAKNVLTVGSINTDTYTIAALSSRGPIFDGRIKPEIVAKGANVTSSVPVNIYDFTTGGTSMASPVVTGSVALLQERYKQLNAGATAKSDLIKALLCNSADDLGNAGPDYTYGFGMVNIRKSVESLEQNQYFTGSIATTGASQNYSINIPSNTRRVKVMLYYIDKEANIAAPKSLVNDLDISVTEPNSTVHLPLILNSIPNNNNDIAVEGLDRINNIEQVVIENPTSGAYTININGFNLPITNQNFVVVYCFEKNGVVLEYPFGNEKLIPGEIEKIRWNGFGNENNTYTLEFSENNGSSWSTIDNNIAGNLRTYNWSVPTIASNQNLFKITRNGTAYTDESDYNFTILEAPLFNITNVCDGYVQVDWSAITNATGYEVMINDADSMKIIGTTNASTFTYLISGLNTSTLYWITVRAKLGSKTGRRAYAKFITPNGGICNLNALDNDIKLVSINTPTTGRYLTNTANNALVPINITIKNTDDIVSNTAINFNYSINGGATVTETASPSINPNATYNYTFATHNPSAIPATYIIKVWVDKTGDTQHNNDTLIKTVKLLTNPTLSLPFTEDFETTPRNEYTKSTIGFVGNDFYDFGNINYGRARTFVNTGFARSGSNAVTLDQLNVGGNIVDTLTGTYNLSNYDTATNQLRVDFYYKDQGQEILPNNKVWVRGSNNDNWIEALNLGQDQDHLGIYNLGKININELFNNASPKQNVSTSFQVAFGQQGRKPSVNINPIDRYEDGYTYDDIKIVNALNDIALLEVINPLKNTCNLTASTPITLKIKNYSNSVQNNIQVNYRINNGSTVTETLNSINSRETINYTFSSPANLGAFIDYSLDFWVTHTTDNYKSNDSIVKYEFHNSPLISSFPYLERFETNDGYWYTKGTNTTWEWGSPVKPIITKAANGTKIWTTALTGTYNDNETSFLNSPCFDLSALTNPTLSFSHISRLEDDCACDYSWMEYSTDGGLNWQKLGAVGQGTNWYNDASTQTWRYSKTYWHVASIPIPTNSTATKFRFVMQSDGGVNYEGIGIDDIHIYESAPIYSGASLTTGLTQNINGNTWQHFINSGNRVVSINANNNNLNNTEVKVYNFTGAVRNSNNQYYLNRNIVIQPTTTPSTPVTVRFYFTDNEVEAVLNATGCGGCTKPIDAYELGVTKYSGTIANENGDLADNTGIHEYILPGNVDIIPYENGYYAEYSVSSFSEFWLNNGGLTFTQPLPVSLIDFSAQKINKDVQLKWQTTNEVNLYKYEIEKSYTGNNFIKIGTKLANNNAVNHYNFMDNNVIEKLNYYRLKMIDANGNFKYSPIRLINNNTNAISVIVSPNPSKNGIVQLNANNKIENIQIVNNLGKIVYKNNINNSIIILDLSHLENGIYTIKIFTEKGISVQKLILE